MKTNFIILGLILLIVYQIFNRSKRYGFKHIKIDQPMYQPSYQYRYIPQVSSQPINQDSITHYTNAYNQPQVSIPSTKSLTISPTSSIPSTTQLDNSIDSYINSNISSNYVQLIASSIATLFDKKVNDAEELGISKEDLNNRVETYRTKYMTSKAKPIPQNIHFNVKRYDETVKNAIRDSALSLTSRNSRRVGDDINTKTSGRDAAMRIKSDSDILPLKRPIATARPLAK